MRKMDQITNPRLILLLAAALLCPSDAWSDSAPRTLAEGQGPRAPQQPQVSVSATGIVDAVFAAGDEIQVCVSRDRGLSFQPAATRISCSNLSAGMRRGPRVIRTKSALVVTAIGGRQGRGRDGDLWAWRSADDGATWSDGVMVNDQPDAAREGLHGMTFGPDGAVWCVWLDLRSSKTEIYAANSNDDGQTWSSQVRVYRSPDGSVCECCHPSIAGGPQSSLRVMFRNSLNGQRDMFLASSTGGGKFLPAKKLGRGSWTLNACPMDGGMLAADHRGGLVTIWQRQGHVFATTGAKTAERDLGEGRQPWAAWSAAGPVVVWTQGREGPLKLQVGLVGKVRELAANARHPVVASDPRQDFAVVCWESRQGKMSAVLTQTIATSPE